MARQEAPSWDSFNLEQYLSLCTSRADASDEFTVQFKNLPIEIQLSKDFHKVLERIRAESNNDNLERWVHFGVVADNQNLYMASEIEIGDEHEVPGDKIWEAMQRAEARGLTMCGHFHTHAKQPITVFSGIDFYNFIRSSYEEYPIHFMGVIGESENLIAMKSREGLDKQPAFSTALPYWFVFEWSRRYKTLDQGKGINYENAWRMNIGIARYYKFGLFKGNPNGELNRVWPDLK